MTLYNGSMDPYHAEESYYECCNCGAPKRTASATVAAATR